MSKIPQGEWTAIAARYAQGETISRIAQSYGCTPPAIHYILKRNRQRTPQNTGLPFDGGSESILVSTCDKLQMAAAPATSCSAEPGPSEYAGFRRAPSESRASHDRGIAPPVRPAQSEQRPAPFPQPQPGNPHKAVRASAFTAGLDRELHGRAEAAIEAFRSSFDAALTESSPSIRQRLREAASDLMRVAARTTIVLDRLNANAERASTRMGDHVRSAQTSEYR